MTEANGPSDGFTVESKNTGRNHVVTFLKRQKKKKIFNVLSAACSKTSKRGI